MLLSGAADKRIGMDVVRQTLTRSWQVCATFHQLHLVAQLTCKDHRTPDIRSFHHM
jgi:hypothetical protein